jgi:hypothetical protein
MKSKFQEDDRNGLGRNGAVLYCRIRQKKRLGGLKMGYSIRRKIKTDIMI